MNPNFYNYRLAVKGVFGRNRKEKFELFLLVKHVPLTEPKSLDTLRPLVTKLLTEIKAKDGCRYVLREEPVEYTPGVNGGMSSESFMMLSEKEMLKGVVGGEEVVPA